MRFKASPRLLIVGRFVAARGSCTRSSPLLDGARIELSHRDGARTTAGGLRIRLSRPGSPGWALVRALDVGWRGLRTPNTHTWPLTARGREYRRMLRRRTFTTVGGCSSGPADLLEPGRRDDRSWPFI